MIGSQGQRKRPERDLHCAQNRMQATHEYVLFTFLVAILDEVKTNIETNFNILVEPNLTRIFSF